MRTVALAQFAILALSLSGAAMAQDQAAPGAPPHQPAAVSPPATAPAGIPPAATPEAAEPALAPKSQDRASLKGDQLQPAPPPAAEARYTFEKVMNGVVRLDRETGQVAWCGLRPEGWTCQPVPEVRAPVEKEFARIDVGLAALKTEVAGLKNEIASLARDIAALRPPPPPPAAAPTPPKPDGLTLKLPTQDDLARARAYVEGKMHDTWRRLVDMIGDLSNDARKI